MKNLLKKIKLFFISLAWGMRGADKIISASNKENDGGEIAGIEQQKESESVYADLLRGEVTQQVKELRHEMYYSERKSHEYEYAGGGNAVKKNDLFGYTGNVEMSDGYPVKIVQENREDPSSVLAEGALGVDAYTKDYRTRDRREFTIKIERDFLPSYRLEQYATKIVVKYFSSNGAIIDIYVPSYVKQFDNTSKMFNKAIERIYMGETRSDIIDFNEVWFISYNAYGSDDLKLYRYGRIKFDDIKMFDGSYVLRFVGDILVDGEDLIEEYYDKSADVKSQNNEPRNKDGATLDVALMYNNQQEEVDVETAKKLIEEMNEN
jgi:hypothetical protein